MAPELGESVLFDLAADPAEEVDVAGQHPEVVSRLRRLVAARSAAPDAPALEVEGDLLEQLKSLGYGR